MLEVLAIPYNYNSFMRQNLKYVMAKSGFSIKAVYSPVLSGVAYAEKFEKKGNIIICEIDERYLQFAVFEVEEGYYEVKAVSGIEIIKITNTYSVADIIHGECLKVLRSSGLSCSDIDNAMLFGQLSDISEIALSKFRELFSHKLDIWKEYLAPSEIGAGLIKDVIKGTKKNLLLLETILPEIIIKIGDGSPFIFMESNRTIPTQKTELIKLANHFDEQYIEISMFEGIDSENILIGKLSFDHSVEEIEVSVEIDTYFNIIFSIRDTITGEEKRLKLL